MNISTQSYNKLNNIWWLLKLTYGLVPIIAGVDKLLNINMLVQWTQYLSDFGLKIFPVDAVTFMRGVGLIEIIAGLLVLSNMTRFGAWLVAIWLLLIVLNLFSLGLYYDVAVRDIVMAIGAIALAKLTNVKHDIET